MGEMTARVAFALIRHLYRLWRYHQLRFRLETFGLYYPSLPYDAPWWRISPPVLLLLIRQLPEYGRWLIQMEEASKR
ncbi:MAG: hypothetical protein ACRDFS_00125 [Chloroflexota bacterium]